MEFIVLRLFLIYGLIKFSIKKAMVSKCQMVVLLRITMDKYGKA